MLKLSKTNSNILILRLRLVQCRLRHENRSLHTSSLEKLDPTWHWRRPLRDAGLERVAGRRSLQGPRQHARWFRGECDAEKLESSFLWLC